MSEKVLIHYKDTSLILNGQKFQSHFPQRFFLKMSHAASAIKSDISQYNKFTWRRKTENVKVNPNSPFKG